MKPPWLPAQFHSLILLLSQVIFSILFKRIFIKIFFGVFKRQMGLKLFMLKSHCIFFAIGKINPSFHLPGMSPIFKYRFINVTKSIFVNFVVFFNYLYVILHVLDPRALLFLVNIR